MAHQTAYFFGRRRPGQTGRIFLLLKGKRVCHKSILIGNNSEMPKLHLEGDQKGDKVDKCDQMASGRFGSLPH